MRAKRMILLPFLLAAVVNGWSQGNGKFTGIWEGKVNLGIELRIVFRINEKAGGLISTADSPDQGAYGLKCDTTIASGDSLFIGMKDLKASFAGVLTADSLLDGFFTQSARLPLSLKKVERPSERKPTQAPQPPFPYKSEEVEYDNKDQSLHYGGTLTLPEGTGTHPAVVLITGSGPQNRDEDIMGHKVFAVLADALSRNGIVVLRVDDRGIGKSTGVFADATSADFASDVNNSLDYLLSRPEVDKKKIGLIGHSEGGMIAPMVATGRKDISFIILLAGPGIKITDLMAEQNAAILRSANIGEKAVASYTTLYKALMQEIVTSADTAQAKAAASTRVQQWVAATDTALLKDLGLDSEKSRESLLAQLVNQFSRKWFRYFAQFDPQPYLRKLTGKVLAINGDRDIQVIATSNLAGIENALKKSRVKAYTIKAMPGLNHLFQTCVKCTLAEYGELEETFSPVALKVINDWVDKNVK